MRPRSAILVAGVLAICAGAARAQDASMAVDAKALCGILGTEAGEEVRAGSHGEELRKLLGDIPSDAACTVTLRDVKNSKVALTLLGMPRKSGQGCAALGRAHRTLAGQGLTARPFTFDYGIRGSLLVEVPPEGSMIPLGMAALLACDGDFLLIGVAGAEAKTRADLDDEIELLRRRSQRTLSAVIKAYGEAPSLATAERDFVGGLLPATKELYGRFHPDGPDCLTLSDLCGEEEANAALDPLIAKYGDTRAGRYMALGEWKYPSGELVFPSLRPVAPVIERLAEKAATDPDAGVALTRFTAMLMRMDYHAASPSTATPKPP